jgi:hypothetical protein
MRAQHEQAQNLKDIMLLDLPHRKEIPEGLRHLMIVDIQKCIVEPVTGKGNTVAALRLGDLIFMVRENQILSTGMDVNRIPQIFA